MKDQQEDARSYERSSIVENKEQKPIHNIGENEDNAFAQPETNPYFVGSEDTPAPGKGFLDHWNRNDLAKLLKCSLALWIMTILVYIDPTLKTLGPTAFVGW